MLTPQFRGSAIVDDAFLAERLSCVICGHFKGLSHSEEQLA
jgi:hypothetical protein